MLHAYDLSVLRLTFVGQRPNHPGRGPVGHRAHRTYEGRVVQADGRTHTRFSEITCHSSIPCSHRHTGWVSRYQRASPSCHLSPGYAAEGPVPLLLPVQHAHRALQAIQACGEGQPIPCEYTQEDNAPAVAVLRPAPAPSRALLCPIASWTRETAGQHLRHITRLLPRQVRHAPPALDGLQEVAHVHPRRDGSQERQPRRAGGAGRAHLHPCREEYNSRQSAKVVAT